MYWSPATFAGAHSYACGYAVQPALRIAGGSSGRMAFFPSFSWLGKCDSRERSESEHQRCVATFAGAHSYGFAYAVRFSLRIAGGSSGKKATFAGALSYACDYAWRPIPASLRAAEGPIREFPGFSRNGTHRVQPALRIAGGSSGKKATFAGTHSSGFAYGWRPIPASL